MLLNTTVRITSHSLFFHERSLARTLVRVLIAVVLVGAAALQVLIMLPSYFGPFLFHP